MATVGSETRTRTHLPDIFRTIHGISLDLGPLDRLRDGKPQGFAGSEVTYEKPSLPWGFGRRVDDVGVSADGLAPGLNSGGMCPRIILRDALGRELDTFTTLQEAIYRAKWNVQQTGQARVPLEWRLPKAPPPARPDLTRTFPPLKHPPIVHDVGTRERPDFSYSRVLEFDVEDVGFVRESLQYLPYAPSLSFLRQEILVGPKTYFQIIGTLLLHKRILTQTEKRNAIYNFPGFCSGCMRTGLCYGCQKNPQLHYHEDRPVRTGGGFTYFKKDRPENEITAKHPMNWKIKHPEQALKMLMEEYAGVELEGVLSDEVKRHLDQQHHAGHTDTPVRSTIPDFAAEMKKLLSKEELRDGVLSDHHVEVVGDFEGDLDGEGHSGKRGQGRGQHPGDGDGAEYGHGQGQEGETESDLEGYQGHYASTVGSEMEQHKGMSVPTHQDHLERKKKKRLDGKYSSEASEDEAKKDHNYDEDGKRIRKYRNNESGDRVTDTDSSNEETEAEKSSRGRRKQRLYKAPPAFKLKKSPTRRIEARSPFSTDRKYDLPKGQGLDIKKSDKKLTQFKDFKSGDVSYKEPKKFELKRTDTKTTKFWSGPPKSKETKRTKSYSSDGRAHRVTSPRPAISPDSGLDSELLTDTTNRSELEPVREETQITPTPEPVMEREPTPQQNLRVKSPDLCRSVTPPKKREIVKKEKKEKKHITPEEPPEQTEDEQPTPTPVSKATSPTPLPSEHSSREASFIRERSVPELPPIEIPELPEIPEKKRYESKVVKKEMKLIEVTPELPPEKKKLPPPPKVRPSYKPSPASRRSKVAEAPVTMQEVRQLNDPLDFLAKYCIINPDRLPYYERVFNGVVNIQSPRYPEFSQPRARGEMVKLPPAQLSDHELAMLKDMAVISHAQTPRRDGLTVPEQYMEKLNYSIEFIRSKQYGLQDHMHQLHAEKLRLMAEVGKSMDRDIVRLDYKTKGKKKRKKKKKKKKKSEDDEYDMMSSIASLKNFRPTKASDITDEVIVSRMDDKMIKKAKKEPAVKKLTLEINRDIEKMKNFDKRVNEIEDEKDLVGLYCMDHYFNEQNCSAAPYEFRRQQSRLYQKLHPDPDVEMIIEEVEAALQQVNNKLLSDREFQYIYFVLDLPKREKINFRLFSVVAALSEKVTQMDPVIRKLINKVDYNALDIKMEKSKELFQLLQDETQMPVGNAPADILAVELTAGGLTPEHTNYVLSKFNREGKGFADFLDFVTYVPLFVEIHRRIIQDPFNDSLDV